MKQAQKVSVRAGSGQEKGRRDTSRGTAFASLYGSANSLHQGLTGSEAQQELKEPFFFTH